MSEATLPLSQPEHIPGQAARASSSELGTQTKTSPLASAALSLRLLHGPRLLGPKKKTEKV